MEYRKPPRGEEQISVIGMGMGIIKPEGTVVEDTVRHALSQGINYFDLCCYYEDAFEGFKAGAKDCDRSSYYVQMHLGAVYKNGEYAFSRNLKRIQETFEQKLDAGGVEYADFVFLHCIDEEKDLAKVLNDGILAYARELKDRGLARHIALSTHTPKIALEVLKQDLIDLMMFSINPAFDYTRGEYAYGEVDERAALYRKAAAMGVGISVMKPFAGGQLLDKRRSPIGVALTTTQCLHYALDKPGVVTVLPGATSPADIDRLMQYFTATEEERDYSVLGSATPEDALGHCVYCNHCSPCPKRINVGLVNKYYDLALLGDGLAREHYLQLTHHASECNDCNHCNVRCPFKVAQKERMHEIAAYFGI